MDSMSAGAPAKCTGIMSLVRRVRRSLIESGVTIISATHDHKMLSVSDRVVWIKDGRVDHIANREELQIEITQVEGE